MTSCLVPHPNWRAAGVADTGSDVSPNGVAITRFECGCRVLSLDVEQLADPRRTLADRDLDDPIWASIRRTLEIFPSPRHGNRRAVLAGIVRQEVERHGLALMETAGISRVVDRRLVDGLSMIPRESGPAEDVFELDTGWSSPRNHHGQAPASDSIRRLRRAAILGTGLVAGFLVLIKLETILVTAGLAAATAIPFARLPRRPARNKSRPTPAFGSERVRVGRGWIETGSGRRRRREQVLTTVMKESDSSDRIEVRIIGDTRVIRMRFESLEEPRFIEFWRRWVGYRSEADSRRVPRRLG